MIVILEGPDGSGKTTLARFLEKEHGFRYIHTGPPETDKVLDAYGRTLYDAHKSGDLVVIDRLHVGERIYGPILRDQDKLGLRGEILIQRLISAYGAQLIFCLPPFFTALANWKARHGEELVAHENTYTAIYNKYLSTMNSVFYNSASWYDYTRMALDTSAKLLLAFHNKEVLPHGVIGSTSPLFLFVGDQANQTYLDLPFFSLNGSSQYLNDCLTEAGYQEKSIALVNAIDLSGSRMPLSEIYATLREPKVIALGGNAHDALNHSRVKHVTIPHPAYWKRFQSDKRDDYVKQLRKIRVETFHYTRNVH